MQDFDYFMSGNTDDNPNILMLLTINTKYSINIPWANLATYNFQILYWIDPISGEKLAMCHTGQPCRFNALTGVQLGGESDAEIEELLPRGGSEGGGGTGWMFEDGCVSVSDDDGGGGRPTLVPSESLVVQL